MIERLHSQLSDRGKSDLNLEFTYWKEECEETIYIRVTVSQGLLHADFGTEEDSILYGTAAVAFNSSTPVCSDRILCENEKEFRLCVVPLMMKTWNEVETLQDVWVDCLEAVTPYAGGLRR